MCTITTTSVLMPLSWLAGIAIFGSFCQLCASFLLNGYFSRSFFMHSLSTLLSFPSYLKLHNLMYLGVDVLTDDTIIQTYTTLNYMLDLHSNTDPILENISQHSVDQPHPKHHTDHATPHPMQLHLIRHSN